MIPKVMDLPMLRVNGRVFFSPSTTASLKSRIRTQPTNPMIEKKREQARIRQQRVRDKRKANIKADPSHHTKFVQGSSTGSGSILEPQNDDMEVDQPLYQTKHIVFVPDPSLYVGTLSQADERIGWRRFDISDEEYETVKKMEGLSLFRFEKKGKVLEYPNKVVMQEWVRFLSLSNNRYY